MGARIVAEVLLGLLEGDPSAYPRAEPGWRPSLPADRPGNFTVVDLLRLAGGEIAQGQPIVVEPLETPQAGTPESATPPA